MNEVPLRERLGPSLAPVQRVAAIVPMWFWVGSVLVVSVVIHSVVAIRNPAPWIFGDELLYWRLAVSVATTGHFLVGGVRGLSGVGPGYPLLLAPAIRLTNTLPQAYDAAKLVNSVLMSLAAVPAYLIARRVVRPWLALLAAIFAVALPSLLYTGVIMTENAFYPAFLFCALAFVRMLERPTLLRQLVALAAIAVAFAIRAQGVLLLPALLTALLMLAVADGIADGDTHLRSLARRLVPYRAAAVTVVVALVALAAFQAVRGRSVSRLLGAYQVVTDSNYTVRSVAKWFVYQLGELDLYLGFLPFAALIVIAVLAFRRGSSRPLRTFAAVATSLAFWVTLTTGAYSSQLAKTTAGVGRIEERNAFHVAPLFLIALLVWVEIGAPRPHRATALAAALTAALPGTLPLLQLVNLSALGDTLAFIPLARAVLRGAIDVNELSVVVVVAALVGTALFLLLPRRLALVGPLCVLAYLLTWQSYVARQMHETSAGIRALSIGGQRNWIDEHSTGPVVALWTGNGNALSIRENQFFNRRLGAVYLVNNTPLGQGSLNDVPATLDEQSGRFLTASNSTLRARYVLANAATDIAGHVEASDPIGFTLYRTKGPVALRSQVQGLFPDGWTSAGLQYTRYHCRGGHVVLTLSRYPGLVPGTQTVAVSSGRTHTTAILSRLTQDRVAVPLQPVGTRCVATLNVSPTAAPSEVLGTPDTRQLGVHLDSVRYVPARS